MKIYISLMISIIFLSLDPNGCDIKKITGNNQGIPEEEINILTGKIRKNPLKISALVREHFHKATKKSRWWGLFMPTWSLPMDSKEKVDTFGLA